MQDGIERRRIIATWAEGELEGLFDGPPLPFESKLISVAFPENAPTNIEQALRELMEQPELLDKFIVYAHNHFARHICGIDWREDEEMTIFAEAD